MQALYSGGQRWPCYSWNVRLVGTLALSVMLAPDTVLQGRYRIVRQLGQGGMGAVYEAVDERLDTIVALKETLFHEERLRKQFEREARLLARLHHQALPRVSDHFNEGDGQFLVMQYIAGEDLHEMLSRRQEAFSQDEVLRWADQLCDALDYLHTQDPQIIHRDIKPQNLKLTARGQVVLLDFGLAKGSAGQMSVVTTSASIFGYTPNYAPLEQVQGLGTDERSDIYSLAATLYHLLTNTKPPDALSRASAIVNGLEDPMVPANRVKGTVSQAVANVLARGMSQKRDERFATAELMRDALRTAAQEPVGAAATVLNTVTGTAAGGKTLGSEDKTRVAAVQTQAFGNEAKTLLHSDAANARGVTAVTEAATVVRPAQPVRSSLTWLVAAVGVVLLACVAAAFYAYRPRSGEAVKSVSVPAPEPSTEPNATDANTSGIESAQIDASKSEKDKAEPRKNETQRSASRQPVEKQEAVSVPSPPNPDQPATSHGDRSQNRDPYAFPTPDLRALEQLRQRRQPGHQPGVPTMPNVRVFPNGTKVITQPDGTRIVTFPDGSTRIIPPPKRKKNQQDRERDREP